MQLPGTAIVLKKGVKKLSRNTRRQRGSAATEDTQYLLGESTITTLQDAITYASS